MFAQSLSRAAIMATLCLAGFASAQRESGDPSPAVIKKSSSTTSARAGDTKISNPDEKVMVSCAGHITQCGVEDKAKIVYVPVSTETVTNEIVTTTVVTLPTSTRIIEKVRVSTVTSATKGHCRETLYLPGEPSKVTLDVIIVKTEEIQPIKDKVTWVVSTVTESAIEQCFIPNYTILGQGLGSRDGDTTFAAAATPTNSSVVSARSSDSVSPAASTPAASDESRSDDDSAQRPLDTDQERPVIIGSDGDISE
ncbi:hypothetical protein FMUND_9265 [Fusarium mundagurra]|uniref:Uncharacterized protein n=1 Tax=Fusarium mundagurra TaxID=1567541 RepID=A0A8H5YF31_9HYPO|nr:hypothetical protein FMUND_9265 [Fusarium mundagurra]